MSIKTKPNDVIVCDFCGKHADAVNHMIASSKSKTAAHICEECVEASMAIILSKRLRARGWVFAPEAAEKSDWSLDETPSGPVEDFGQGSAMFGNKD